MPSWVVLLTEHEVLHCYAPNADGFVVSVSKIKKRSLSVGSASMEVMIEPSKCLLTLLSPKESLILLQQAVERRNNLRII